MAEKHTYEIRLTYADGGSGTIENRARARTQTPTESVKVTEDVVNNKPNIKVLGTLGAVWGATQTIAQPILTQNTNNALLSGDLVQAKTIQIQGQKTTKLVNMAFSLATIGALAMTNPATATFALGAFAVGQVTQAINISEQNRVIRAQNDINNFIQSVDANRLVGGLR